MNFKNSEEILGSPEKKCPSVESWANRIEFSLDNDVDKANDKSQ